MSRVPPSSRRLRLARAGVGVLLCAWLAALAQYAGILGGIDGAITGDGLYFAVLGGAVLACGARAALIPGHRGAWALLALAAGLWSLGDVCWTYVYGGAGGVPSPSLCDLFYFAFYPPVFAVLLAALRRGADRRRALDWMLAAGVLAVAGLELVAEPLASATGHVSPSLLVNFAYPVLDALTMSLLSAVIGSRAGSIGRVLRVLTAGIACFCLGDSVYVYRVATGGYVEGQLLDASWMTGLVIFAAAAWTPEDGFPLPRRLLRSSTRVRAGLATVAGGLRLPALAAAATAIAILALLGYGARTVPDKIEAEWRESTVVSETLEAAERAHRALTWAALEATAGRPHEADRLAAVRANERMAAMMNRLADVDGGIPARRVAAQADRYEAAARGELVRLAGYGAGPAVPLPSLERSFSELQIALDTAQRRTRERTARIDRQLDVRSLATVVMAALLAVLMLRAFLRRRRAQALEGAQRAAVQHSERRFRSIVQRSSDALFIVGPDGLIRTATGATETLLGHSSASLEGRSVLEIVHADDHDAAVAFLAEVAHGQRGEGVTEWRLAHRSGHWTHLETAAVNLLGDGAVDGIVLTSRDVTARKALEEQLRHRAFHDPLTQLPNRALFYDRLEHALSRGEAADNQLAVLFLDLDEFKVTNDRLGHAAGDELLTVVARRLRGALRSADTAARLGGDEFGILVENVHGPHEAVDLAERVLRVLNEPIVLGGTPLTVGASIGVAVSDAASVSEELLRQADVAMYLAKRAGRGRHVLFHAGLELAHPDVVDPGAEPDRATWFARSEEQRAEISSILETPGALVPVFQPLLDLRSGTVAGYEALTRFPGREERPVHAWFAHAHRHGLGPALEALAIRTALAVPRPEGTYLSINVSPSSLFSDEVAAVLPARLHGLVIEVTENEIAAGSLELRAKLTELKARGARIAVDDAGAGYAGLKQLMVLRPDIVKLDRVLVDGIASEPAKLALVESFVRFGLRVGAEICAEGVEKLDDLEILADADVAYAQGFVIAEAGHAWPAADRTAAALVRDRFARMLSAPPGDEVPAGGEELLARVSERLAGLTSLAGIDEILELAGRALHAPLVHCSLLDEASGVLRPIGLAARTLPDDCYPLADHPLLEEVLRTMRAAQVRVDDLHGDAAERAFLRDQTGTRAMLVVPLVADGRSIGVIQAHSLASRWWTRAEIARGRTLSFCLGGKLAGLDAQPPAAAPLAPPLPLA